MANTQETTDDIVKQESEQPIEKRVIAENIIGKVKWFNVKRGYGFVCRDDNQEDVFIHQSAIIKSNPQHARRSVGENESIKFDIVEGTKGNEAANVTSETGESVQGSEYALRYPRGRRGRGRGGRGRGRPRMVSGSSDRGTGEYFRGRGQMRGGRPYGRGGRPYMVQYRRPPYQYEPPMYYDHYYDYDQYDYNQGMRGRGAPMRGGRGMMRGGPPRDIGMSYPPYGGRGRSRGRRPRRGNRPRGRGNGEGKTEGNESPNDDAHE